MRWKAVEMRLRLRLRLRLQEVKNATAKLNKCHMKNILICTVQVLFDINRPVHLESRVYWKCIHSDSQINLFFCLCWEGGGLSWKRIFKHRITFAENVENIFQLNTRNETWIDFVLYLWIGIDQNELDYEIPLAA